MSRKSLVLALVFIFNSVALHPQSPSFYHYTPSDGLASSTVFGMLQDKEGFIWFATQNGLSRFDSKHFITYRTADGLNSNAITSVVEGEDGRLFIGNYEKGINVLKNGKIKNYCNQIDGKSFAISYLLLDHRSKDEQKLFAYRSWGSINMITEQKPGRMVTHSVSTSPVYINRLLMSRNGEIIALTPTGLFGFKNTRLIKIPITGLPDTVVLCRVVDGDDNSYLGSRGIIYKVKNNKVCATFRINIAGNNDVCYMLADKNNNIWFSVMNKGFYLIPAGTDKIFDIGSKLGLQNTLVNDYLEDTEGNIWVSTFGKGVYCLNNLYLKSYNEDDGLCNNNVYSIFHDGSGKLFIGTFNGISIIEDGNFYPFKSKSNRTLTDYIYRIKSFNNDLYICAATGATEIETIAFKGIKMQVIDRQSFCITHSGLYLFGTGGNFLLVQNKLTTSNNGYTLFPVFGDSNMINRINELFEDSENNLWIGTTMGLCKITRPSADIKEWKKSFFPGDPVLSSRINSIYEDNKHNVWFAGEKGISLYHSGDRGFKTLTAVNGYDLSSSTSIIADNKDRIWIGNMKGLFLIDGNSVKFLSRQTGLPSDEVLSLCFNSTENILYVGTSNGISLLDVSLFDSYRPSPPKVKIIRLKAGDSVYTSYRDLEFKPEQHDVLIELKAINFSSSGSVKYQYKLNDDEWKAIDYDFLNFISLRHGTYYLQVRSKAPNTAWSEPCLLNFRVLPHFTETIWFDFIIISVIILIAFLIAAWRLRIQNIKTRKEVEMNERFNELKHLALSAMMNPHFISNSLNSVQYLVNSGKYEEANDYIAMIAKLMRKNLDTAGSGFILLSEEISRLRLYLDLEKLRFQESFAYEIITGPDIETGRILIPNMIIQPFVENSLWHGIINSGKEGLLTISFSFEDVEIDSSVCSSLIIKIADNGIGIEQAKKNKKEDHISKGIQIIEERLSLLSSRMKLPQPIVFEDLGGQDAGTHGTEVIISLPPPLFKFSPQG